MVFPLQRTDTLPDGGHAYVYDVQGDILTYKIPPHGFNPLQAGPAQLAEYGLPPRPRAPGALAQWTRMMQRMKLVPPPPHLIGAPIQASTTPTTSLNWSGYMATSSSASAYYFIEGIWYEPSITANSCGSTSEEVTWVGLGGSSGNLPLAQDGTIAGNGYNHQAWSEVLPDQPTIVLQPLSAQPGYEFTAEVNLLSGGGGYNFYMYDSYTGNSVSFQQATNSYDGSTAEFITERPLNTNTEMYYPLADFGEVEWADTWVNSNSSSSYGIGSYPNDQITMTSNGDSSGTLLASPGSIYDNQLFYDYYYNCD